MSNHPVSEKIPPGLLWQRLSRLEIFQTFTDDQRDAFLKAYEKLDQFQGNSKFYTWLVRIAVNESLMRLRKRRTGKMVSIDEDVVTEDGTVLQFIAPCLGSLDQSGADEARESVSVFGDESELPIHTPTV